MKLLTSLLDLLLRAAACVTVLGICLLALFIGGMAGVMGLFVIILPVMALSTWVVLCACLPGKIARMLPDSAAWRVVLMKLPVYAVACIGIYYGVSQWQVRYGAPSVMVGKRDAQFPASNPNPAKILEISGTLPLTVPVKDLVAIYTTDADSAQKSSACTRRNEFMPENDTTRDPLVHIEHVPMARTGENYRSSVAIDRFLPGPCGWRLTAVRYLLDVKGYSEKDFANRHIVFPHVEFSTQPQPGGDRSNQSAVLGGRADVWCWKVTNHEYNPFVAVRCGDIKDALSWPGQHASAALSVADRHSVGTVYAGPEISSVEFNFHDFDAPRSQPTEPRSQPTEPRSQPTEPPSQVRETGTPARDTLPAAAAPQRQFIASPTQAGEGPTPVNVAGGRPVNISIGEALADVETALGSSAALEPTHSATHSHVQLLTLKGRGVRLFFDESKNIYTIRIDAPFACKLGGAEIIRTRAELDNAPGPPAKEIAAIPSHAGRSFLYDMDASTKVRYDFDYAGRVTSVFVLSGTVQIGLDGN